MMLGDLNPKQIQALRDLHKINPLYNLKIPIFYVLATLVGWIILRYPFWAVRIPAYFFMANIFLGIGVFMHDGAHGLLLKNSFLNRSLSRVLAGSELMSFTQFRQAHLTHHWYPLTKEDPDRFFYRFNIPLTLLLSHSTFYSATFKHLRTADRKVMRDFWIEAAFTMPIFLAIVVFSSCNAWLSPFIHVYLIPYLMLGPLLFTRFVAEHFDCDPDNDYTIARTLKSNALCRWLWNNIQFHAVHHFYPGIPWYNLKKAHEILEPHLIQNGAHIDSGYLKVLAKAIKRYGLSTPAYWKFPPKSSVVFKKRRPSLGLPAEAPSTGVMLPV